MPKFGQSEDAGYQRIVQNLSLMVERMNAMPKDDEPEVLKQDMGGIKARSREKPGSDGLDQVDRFLELLAFSDMGERQAGIEHPSGQTCKWLLTHPIYEGWHENGRSILWLLGHPGTGKSTLTKFAVQSSSETGETCHTAFFFYGLGTKLQSSAEGFLRSTVHQIISHSPSTFIQYLASRSKRWNQSHSPGNWQTPELFELLEGAISVGLSHFRIRVFVDALDECKSSEERELIVDNLREMVTRFQSSSNSFSICVSSRHVPRSWPLSEGPRIRLEDENSRDVEEFVQQAFAKESAGVDEIIKSLESKIIKGANGSFQWTKLVTSRAVRMYRDGEGGDAIRDMIDSVHDNLSAIYEGIVKSLLDRSPSLSYRLFNWLCFAFSPPSISQLRAALNAKPLRPSNGNLVGHSPAPIASDEQMERLLPTISGGLVEVKDIGVSLSREINIITRPNRPGTQGISSFRIKSSGTYWYLDLVMQRRSVFLIHQSVKDYMVTRGLSLFNHTLNSRELAITHGHEELLAACVQCFAEDAQGTLSHMTAHVKEWSRSLADFEIRSKYVLESFFEVMEGPILHFMGRPDIYLNLFNSETVQDAIHQLLGLDDDSPPLNDPSTATSMQVRHDKKSWKLDAFLKRNPELTSVACLFLQILAAIQRLNFEFPFFLYCTAHLVDHLFEAKVQSSHDIAYLRRPLNSLASSPALKECVLDPAAYAATRFEDSVLLSTVLSFYPESDLSLARQDEFGQRLLTIAAGNGYLKTVHYILEHYSSTVSVNARGFNGRSVLSSAAGGGHLEIIDVLLQHGADLQTRDYCSCTALLLAANQGHLSVVKRLVERGADLTAQNCGGYTALTRACIGGHEEVVRYLVEKGVDINKPSNHGETPLYISWLWGHEALGLFLESRGAILGDVNLDILVTHLYKASRKGDISALDFILKIAIPSWRKTRNESGLEEERHAIIEFPSSRNPFHAALIRDDPEVLRRLCDEILADGNSGFNTKMGSGGWLLRMAVTELAPKCISLLVKHFGHDINYKDALGDTFLHRLVRFGSQDREDRVVETAGTLLECGIDTSVINSNGFSALMLAAVLESDLFPVLVMSDKVDPNIQTEQGTALLCAAKVSDSQDVEILLARKDILPEIGLPSGFSPMHAAACEWRDDVAELLLADRKRAKRIADCEDRNGVTPLSVAARLGQLNIVKMLVETGLVEVDHPDANGRTPLSNAAECDAWDDEESLDQFKRCDYVGVITFLCSQEGVDANQRDIAGCTPLDWAFESLSRRKQSVGRASNGEDHPPLESVNTGIVRDETNGRVSPGLGLQSLSSNSCLELELHSRTKIIGILISHGSFLTPGGPPRSNETDFWDGCELESDRHICPGTESERLDSDFLPPSPSEFSLSDTESTTSKAPPEDPEPSAVEVKDSTDP